MLLLYQCIGCGLTTRVEQGQDHVACGCRMPYDITYEDGTPAIDPMPQPQDPQQ